MAEPAYPLSFLEPDDERAWPAQGQWSYKDYLRLPNDGRRYEVIRGSLYVAPAPDFDHQFSAGELYSTFRSFIRENDLGIVLFAPFDILLPGGLASPVQPDIVFFRKGNLPRPGSKNFVGVPDLVVEVLSPSTRHLDDKIKLAAYCDAGIPEYWRVDPVSRTIVVHGLSPDGRRYEELARGGVGETVASGVLPGLRVEVVRIFPPQG